MLKSASPTYSASSGRRDKNLSRPFSDARKRARRRRVIASVRNASDSSAKAGHGLGSELGQAEKRLEPSNQVRCHPIGCRSVREASTARKGQHRKSARAEM